MRPGQPWDVFTFILGGVLGGLWRLLFSLQLVVSAKSFFKDVFNEITTFASLEVPGKRWKASSV